jgi:alkylation response protein AidB-like acyl-CoA dehydrogenase
MPIALSDEHEEQRRSARRWLTNHCPSAVPRALLDAEVEELQPVWTALAAQAWLGVHLPEAMGGQGGGLFELAVILEEAGWSMLPGPFLPTVAASALLAEALDPHEASRLLPGLIDGSRVGAVCLKGPALEVVERRPSGDVVVSGRLRPVLGGALASVILAPAGDADGGVLWCVIEVEEADPAVAVTALSSLDTTRRVASVEVTDYTVAAACVLASLRTERVNDVVLALLAAEHVGGARWCLETATAYAKVRVQFGRPIGQFQAVKHRLADMAVRVEQMTAVAWDAATAVAAGAAGDADGVGIAAATAGALCLDGYVQCAKDCMQLHGGIGFTWEHDVHLHLKRALADRALAGGSEPLCREVAEAAGRGVRRALTAELPDEADRWRTDLAPIVEALGEAAPGQRRALLVEAGLCAPNWPRPWGRDATAVEQVVIDELLAEAHIERPHIAVGAWALPAIIAYGSEDQCARWVRPTLMGDITWCQLFSEPGAGSDLASLATRAEQTEGGWSLSGQKVWTSMANVADWGICLARTDPSAPKHDGITYFIVDMHAPGLDIRPLREITGAAMFNEVFFDSVFVPDDCVIGEVNRGWPIARVTLANERVSMSSGSAFGFGVEALLRLAAKTQTEPTTDVATRLGSLVAEAESLRLMTHRSTLLSLAGADPGSGASLRKLLGAEHEQRVQELGLAMLGREGATTEGSAARWAGGFLSTRCLTIAGGTSEVQRNVIAERILGLPRDPEPAA